MSDVSRVRPTGVGAILAAVAATVLASAPQRAAEPAGGLPVELQYVPADALAFAHVNVEALWKSPFGATVRKLKLPGLDPDLKALSAMYGLAPDDIRTVTAYLTELEDDEEPRFAVILTTVKEYDRKVILDAVENSRDARNGKYENKDNVIRIVPKDGPATYLDLTDAKRIVFGVNLTDDPKADPNRAAGVHTATLKHESDPRAQGGPT